MRTPLRFSCAFRLEIVLVLVAFGLLGPTTAPAQTPPPTQTPPAQTPRPTATPTPTPAPKPPEPFPPGAQVAYIDLQVVVRDSKLGKQGHDAMQALNDKLGSLPGDTHFYFGHEYTENNLRFAASLEPENPDIERRRTHVADQRSAGAPTTPTTLADERRTNPFLRCYVEAVVRAAGLEPGAAPVDVLGRVRKLKDDF